MISTFDEKIAQSFYKALESLDIPQNREEGGFFGPFNPGDRYDGAIRGSEYPSEHFPVVDRPSAGSY